MKNKTISAFLASLLTISLLTCSASAMDFPDVDSNSPYSTAIQYVSELGVMVGGSNGNFNPNQIVSRCEMATIICRMLGMAENLSKSEVFTDVPTTHWANAYVGKVAELGIVGGYGNGKYGPGDPVTYEQAVTMIVRAIGESDRANYNGGYPNGFIKVAQEKNLLNGIQAVQGQGLSRGSVAMLLYNYYTTQNNPGTSSNVGEHTHNYVEKTVPGSGHYEQVLVRYDYEPIYETRRVYECKVCKGVFNSYEEFDLHCGFRTGNWDFDNPCLLAGSYFYDAKVKVGEKEVPIYENKWVEDTIRVCSICGQQEP